MRWQAVLKGAVLLALLDAVLSSTTSAGRVGSLLDDIAGLVARVMDPTVPAIADRRKHGGAAPPSNSTTTGGSSGSSTMPTDWSTSASALMI